MRAPTIWFPDSLMTTMQATPSSKMAFYTLSAANAMNNTKALHLAPVPDSMLIGEVGSCSVWPTTGQGARGPPTGSCFLLLSVDSFRCRQPVYPYMKKRRSYDYMSRGTLAVAELDLLYGSLAAWFSANICTSALLSDNNAPMTLGFHHLPRPTMARL